MSTATQTDRLHTRQGEQLGELSNAVVAIYKEVFGRGPTRARTSYAGPDALIAVLEEIFTPAERKLTEIGMPDRVRGLRVCVSSVMERDLIEAVTRITGRQVRCHMSSVDVLRDTSCEVFLLQRAE